MEAALPPMAGVQGHHDHEREDLPSASSASRRIKCPGSHKLSVGKREVQSPEMADWRNEGNRIHDWLRIWLPRRLGMGVGTAPLDGPTLSDHEQDVADRCVEQTRELVYRIFPNLIQTSGSLRLIQEQRMWLYFQDGRHRHSGKADAIFMWKDPVSGWRCLLIDFKTNRGDIEDSPQNSQLRELAVLLWVTLGGKVSSIDVAIIQPLVSKLKDPTCYEVPDLHIAHNRLLDSLALAEQPDPPLRHGHEQCQFCPAKLSCPALKEICDTLTPDVLGASPEELADWLEKAEPIVHAYASARNAARAWLELVPNSVPGWQLDPNSPNREITNPKTAYDLLVESGHMDLGTFLEQACTLTIGKLKEALIKRNKLKPQRLADDIINNTCAPALTLKDKQPSLVRT